MDWSNLSTTVSILLKRMQSSVIKLIEWTKSSVTVLAAWLPFSWYWLLIIGVAIIVVLSAWWFWLWWPRRQAERLRFTIRDAKARADVEDNFRKTLSQFFGGIAVLVGAVVAYSEFQQQQQASREVLLSNQVSKGFEQLGNEKFETRLGGIYALEGVMNTSEKYHLPVLEALCAFVREHTKQESVETRKGPPNTDVQAALTVIGRRIIRNEEELNLNNIHIPKANLKGAKLQHANMSEAYLRGALLIRADLVAANLFHADLVGANLFGADLHWVILNDAALSDIRLFGADLRNAQLNGADLIGADLRRVRLDDAHLNRSILIGAHLFRANLSRVDLRGADLNGAFLDSADLSGADLRGARNLSQEQLDRACGTDVQLDPPLMIKRCNKLQ